MEFSHSFTTNGSFILSRASPRRASGAGICGFTYPCVYAFGSSWPPHPVDGFHSKPLAGHRVADNTFYYLLTFPPPAFPPRCGLRVVRLTFQILTHPMTTPRCHWPELRQRFLPHHRSPARVLPRSVPMWNAFGPVQTTVSPLPCQILPTCQLERRSHTAQ